MDKPSESLIDWFSGRPQWLQFAASALNNSSKIDLEYLLSLCIRESSGELNGEFPAIALNGFTAHPTGYLRLESISNIQGINALAPRKPINFTNDKITVVFGNNGSGKSGYVRLLKHLSGTRLAGMLYGNVYHPEQVSQKATIAIKVDNEVKSFSWDGSNRSGQPLAIDVFDTSFGTAYIADGDEVRYEPPLLMLFDKLISCCESLALKIDEHIGKLPPKKPLMPNSLATTSFGKWYGALTGKVPHEDVLKSCSITAMDSNGIIQLEKRLTEKAPAEKANLLRKQKQYLDSIIDEMSRHIFHLEIKNSNIIFELKNKINTQRSAIDAASQEFSNSVAFNIGSDIWRELWNAARKYSETVAYSNQEFPFINDGAHCVLCQQPLTDDAKKRLVSFEFFVKGELESSYNKSIQEYRDLYSSIEETSSFESINAKIDAAGEQCIVFRDRIIAIFKSFSERRKILLHCGTQRWICSLRFAILRC